MDTTYTKSDDQELQHVGLDHARASLEDKKIGEGIYESDVIPEMGETTRAIDPAAERRLVWKFDLRILPVLAVMYLFNSLDK